MKNFQRVQEEALGSHGILTYKTMHQMGILSPEIARWTHQGWLVKVGHGVYRLATYPSQGIVSDMAAILAEVGEEAYLYGESVLGFLGLCPTRSSVAFIATPKRVRRTLPQGVSVIRGKVDYRPVYLNGIPCQRPADAILSSVGTVEPERLVAAVKEARQQGYFTEAEANDVKERISNGRTAAQ